MTDPNELPLGSRLLGARTYDGYDVEVYERPDRLIHFVLTANEQPPEPGREFFKALDRANDLAVETAGRPCHRWTLQSKQPPKPPKPRPKKGS
jgi:hypothetical protein